MPQKRKSILNLLLIALLIGILEIVVGIDVLLPSLVCPPNLQFKTPNICPLFWGNANSPSGGNTEIAEKLLNNQDGIPLLAPLSSCTGTSMSKLTRREKVPLLADFAAAFLQSCEAYPNMENVFAVGNLDGQTAGSNFLPIMKQDYINRGIPEGSKMAEYAGDAITSTYDFISSRQIPYLLANIFGNFMLDRGLLTAANAETLASAAAATMANAADKVKPTDPEGFALSGVNGVFDFFESLGCNINDIVWDITLYFETELKCLSKGICE